MATTISELQDTVDTIHERALLTSQFGNPMAALCWKINKGKGQSTVNIPYFNTITADVLTEGVDMVTDKKMQDTNVQVALNEVGAKIILTDVALEDDKEELQGIAGNMLGNAIAKKQDQDLLALLDNGTNSLAGSGTTLTMGHFAAAKALLLGNAESSGGPAPMPYVAVIHPFQTLDLVDVMTPIVPVVSAASIGYQAMPGSFGEDVLRNYTISRIFGMNVVEDGNLTIDASADAKGGVFAQGNQGAIALVTARSWDVRPERDESLRGWELNCVGRYGVGNYLNGWTVELYADATTPA
jgi:N4-gp56 family major capsid protein